MRFSQRAGFVVSEIDLLQQKSMSNKLRKKIWDGAYVYFFKPLLEGQSPEGDKCFYLIWVDFLDNLVDEVPFLPSEDERYTDNNVIFDELKNWYFSTEWYHVYDLLEYVVELIDRFDISWGFEMNGNIFLREAGAGYRFVNKRITPITSPEEIKEVNNVFENGSKWDPVKEHFAKSIYLFSNRENPDYTNSLKESISAVESACRIIVGEKKKGLGAYLSEIGKKYNLDGGIKQGFNGLYGHASNNARHGRAEDSEEITMAYARFMLVSCSAFVNYLIELDSK